MEICENEPVKVDKAKGKVNKQASREANKKDMKDAKNIKKKTTDVSTAMNN